MLLESVVMPTLAMFTFFVNVIEIELTLLRLDLITWTT